MAKRSANAYLGSGVPTTERPWRALTQSQRDTRLDAVAFHEGQIFQEFILRHPVKRVRVRAEDSDEKGMKFLVRAYKLGIDLVQVGPAVDLDKGDWTKLARAPLEYSGAISSNPTPSLPASPRRKASRQHKAKVAEMKTAEAAKPIEPHNEALAPASTAKAKPPSWEGVPDPMPWRDDLISPEKDEAKDETPQFAPARGRGRPSERFAHAGVHGKATAENGSTASPGDDGPVDERAQRLAEYEAIRSKLVVNGKVRLDLEAISAYMLAPSFFAVASGLNPENWQAQFLDSYASRLGCLAARQSGKSIVTARKAVCFAMCNPATTTLILAPTLRQSSELLAKISGTVQIAGLKIAALSQFQLVLSDKQPGAASRIVCLPGSNEGGGQVGVGARGYTADLLILEEASFLSDGVIGAVLPSIAARPRAQLVGISSAGILGSFFHSVMTSPQSRWQKIVVPASISGRFSAESLADLKENLGESRYNVEMQCVWGSIGDSIYGSDIMEQAFGVKALDGQEIVPELDPEAAFAHLDLETIFGSQPFPRKVA